MVIYASQQAKVRLFHLWMIVIVLLEKQCNCPASTYMFTVRKKTDLLLFEPTLCAERWTLQYYKSSQYVLHDQDTCNDEHFFMLQVWSHRHQSKQRLPDAGDSMIKCSNCSAVFHCACVEVAEDVVPYT